LLEDVMVLSLREEAIVGTEKSNHLAAANYALSDEK